MLRLDFLNLAGEVARYSLDLDPHLVAENHVDPYCSVDHISRRIQHGEEDHDRTFDDYVDGNSNSTKNEIQQHAGGNSNRFGERRIVHVRPGLTTGTAVHLDDRLVLSTLRVKQLLAERFGVPESLLNICFCPHEVVSTRIIGGITNIPDHAADEEQPVSGRGVADPVSVREVEDDPEQDKEDLQEQLCQDSSDEFVLNDHDEILLYFGDFAGEQNHGIGNLPRARSSSRVLDGDEGLDFLEDYHACGKSKHIFGTLRLVERTSDFRDLADWRSLDELGLPACREFFYQALMRDENWCAPSSSTAAKSGTTGRNYITTVARSPVVIPHKKTCPLAGRWFFNPPARERNERARDGQNLVLFGTPNTKNKVGKRTGVDLLFCEDDDEEVEVCSEPTSRPSRKTSLSSTSSVSTPSDDDSNEYFPEAEEVEVEGPLKMFAVGEDFHQRPFFHGPQRAFLRSCGFGPDTLYRICAGASVGGSRCSTSGEDAIPENVIAAILQSPHVPSSWLDYVDPVSGTSAFLLLCQRLSGREMILCGATATASEEAFLPDQQPGVEAQLCERLLARIRPETALCVNRRGTTALHCVRSEALALKIIDKFWPIMSVQQNPGLTLSKLVLPFMTSVDQLYRTTVLHRACARRWQSVTQRIVAIFMASRRNGSPQQNFRERGVRDVDQNNLNNQRWNYSSYSKSWNPSSTIGLLARADNRLCGHKLVRAADRARTGGRVLLSKNTYVNQLLMATKAGRMQLQHRMIQIRGQEGNSPSATTRTLSTDEPAVQLLRQTLQIRDRQGRTPVDYARINGWRLMCDFFADAQNRRL
ncbi:unnamed protein product [Amoebophrya sp. A25]|nr:unnamed protein product [Amoebophrya sp. A25]|eukprot:GSA25T00024534001.1